MCCHCDDYNEAVISISPQLEPHLLQAVIFLDPETPKYGFVCHRRLPRLGLPGPVRWETGFQRACHSQTAQRVGAEEAAVGSSSLQNSADADGALMTDTRPQVGVRQEWTAKYFGIPLPQCIGCSSGEETQ